MNNINEPPLAAYATPENGASASILLRTIKISRMVIDLVIEIDDGGEAVNLGFGDFDGDRVQQMPLIASGGPGSPTYAPLRIPYECERVLLVPNDVNGQRIEKLVQVLDVERLAFLSVEDATLLPPGELPAGAKERAAALNNPAIVEVTGNSWNGISLISAEEVSQGLLQATFKLADRGVSAYCRATCGKYPSTEVQVHRSDKEPTLGVVVVEGPADSFCIGLEFYTKDGDYISFLACRFLVKTKTFIHQGQTTLASSQELTGNPLVQEIMITKPTASTGGVGAFILEHAINIIGYRKEEGTSRFLYVVDEPCKTVAFHYLGDDESYKGTVQAYLFPLYQDAGPLFAEFVIPDTITEFYVEPINNEGKPVAGGAAIFNTRSLELTPVATKVPAQEAVDDPEYQAISANLPPDYKLQKKLEFGPPGIVVANKAVAILRAARSGDGPLQLTIFLDDGGHFASVCWWHENMEYVHNTTFQRATPTCPAVIELVISQPRTAIYLDFADSFERTSLDLSAILDLSKETLSPQKGTVSPARERYRPSSAGRGKCRCLACKKEKTHETALHISELPEDERQNVLSHIKFNWDYPYLCDKCRHRINAGDAETDISDILYKKGLSGYAAGLFKAYVATWLIFITPGHVLTALFTGMPFYFTHGGATFASAVLFATVLSIFPIGAAYRFVSEASSYLDEGNMFRQLVQIVGIPAFIIILVTDAYFSFTWPYDYPVGTNPFAWEFLYYAAIAGFSVGRTSLSAIERLLKSGQDYKKTWDARFKRASRILSAMGNLVNVDSRSELLHNLETLLSGEMAVGIFVWFEPDEQQYFLPRFACGTELETVKKWRIKSGDPGLPGQALMFHDVLDEKTYIEGLNDGAKVNDMFPSLWALPVSVDQDIKALLTISSFTRKEDRQEMEAFLPTLGALLGAALDNIQKMDAKNQQLKAVELDKMAAEERAEFLRQTFSKTVAPEVVDHLIASPESFCTGGEERVMTIFYSDIRSFTSLAEKISARDMVELLNEYFDEMAQLVFKYEGTIDKWIGDAVMAFFGAPNEQIDHARRAISMSIEMMHALDRLNARWHQDGRFAAIGVPGYDGLKIGIGLHSGSTNVGFLGAKTSRVDYTVIGDTVNTSARLVSKAGASEILVSHQTAEMSGLGFKFEECPPMELKGKAEPVKVYKVLY